MTYLNSGWAGPSPESVIDRMREAAAAESAAGPAGPEGQTYAKGVEKYASSSLLDMTAIPDISYYPF